MKWLCIKCIWYEMSWYEVSFGIKCTGMKWLVWSDIFPFGMKCLGTDKEFPYFNSSLLFRNIKNWDFKTCLSHHIFLFICFQLFSSYFSKDMRWLDLTNKNFCHKQNILYFCTPCIIIRIKSYIRLGIYQNNAMYILNDSIVFRNSLYDTKKNIKQWWKKCKTKNFTQHFI